MDNKLLLVKSIVLLYRESLLPDRNENSASLVRTALENIKVNETGLTLSKTSDIIIGLKNTALDMCGNSDVPEFEYVPSDLLQTLKMNCGDDESLYGHFSQAIEQEMSEASLKRTIINGRKTLLKFHQFSAVKKLINKASFTINNEVEKIKDPIAWLRDFSTSLEPYQQSINTKDPAVLNDVELHDLEKVRTVFAQIEQEESGESIFKTGWQGINRMLDGGFRRGEQWVIGALQHNWKSGFSLTLFKQIALYNKPVMIDPTKKPLLLRISFEDSIQINFKFLYKSLKENEEGRVVSTVGITNEEMARYVQEKLTVNGFYIKLLEVDPSRWTYKDICNKIVELEAEGYEVQLCMLDYLLKVPTTGCDQGPMGHDIRNMYERTRAFMTSRRITMITPHQLSTDAKAFMRDQRQDLVKQLVGGGYYSGSKQIDQVVDGEIFMHIEKHNKEAYLTIQRGKHRKVSITPEEHLYAVYKFVKNGVVMDDLDKPDTMRHKVGGPPIDEGGGSPFHQYDDAQI